MIRFLASALILAAAAAAPAAAQPRQPAPAGDVIGVGNFAHIVSNLENSLAFYHDVLGLEISVQPTQFARSEMNEAIMKMGATEGGQSRIAALKVPGIALGIELIEYKDIKREPQNPHFKDPGAANMSLRVHGLDAMFPKIEKHPGVKILSAGGKPVTLETPNGTLHALFMLDPDGFVVEMLDVVNPPAGSPAGFVLGGGSFEATVANSEESVKFYKDMLGFDMKLGASFNDNQQMASTAGAPGASFRQSTATIPGTSVPFTLIEFKNIERKHLSGRTQDPGTTVLQLVVKDVTALTAKLKAAGVPIVSTGGAPVQVAPGLKIAIARDPNNMLLELVERAPR